MDFVDEEMEPNPELNRITNSIIGSAIEVHKQIGPGHPESFYQAALEIQFKFRGILVVPQYPIDVRFRDHVVGTGRLDFLVENRVVVEIISVELFARLHTAQVVSYLRASRFRLGILINFNVPLLKEGIRRIAN